MLYLDNHLLVADKPWGLLTQPSGTDEPSLEEEMKSAVKERFNKPGAVFLEAVHRIDRVVGGTVLFARTSKALSRLNEQQRASAIKKIYHARVFPAPKNDIGELGNYIIHDDFQARIVSHPTSDAKQCVLSYRVLERASNGTALLEIHLKTGRYHQIRAQLSHAGMPIVGDVKYHGVHPEWAPQGGIALVSHSLDFTHPVTHEIMHIQTLLTP